MSEGEKQHSEKGGKGVAKKTTKKGGLFEKFIFFFILFYFICFFLKKKNRTWRKERKGRLSHSFFPCRFTSNSHFLCSFEFNLFSFHFHSF
jgi:hypothetical protein